MALTRAQQVLDMIQRSNRPLICIPKGAGSDGYATALGLARACEKLGKEDIAVVAADGPVPKNLRFLPGHKRVQPKFRDLRRFVIELDASKTKVNELSYEMKDDRLLIHLTPKDGAWRQEDVKFSATGFRYDLIIAVCAPDLASFGELFESHPDFFYHTPIINIDHAPENEQFGHVNCIDVTASACGELCHALLREAEPELIDERVATAFLTGMIAKTKSFKHPRVTPKTLERASALVAAGAERERIVESLYRTRSVPTLRLWGRALARLKADEARGIVWTLLSRQDFLQAGAEEDDLPDVIDELIATSPHAKVAAVLYEDADGSVMAVVRCGDAQDAAALLAPLGGTGTREEARISFKDTTIVKAEKRLLARL